MPKIKLELNSPIECALKFGKGKHYDSTLPGKAGSYMYSLKSGDVIFIDEDDCQEPDQMFHALNIGANVPFRICLRKRNGARYYEVQNLSQAEASAEPPTKLESTLAASVEHAKAQRALSTPAALQLVRDEPVTTTNDSNPAPIAHTVISKLMASSLIAAFDATQEAERYAESKGLKLAFGAEDVRAISNTIFIALSKEPGFGIAPRVNAGAQSWQQ